MYWKHRLSGGEGGTDDLLLLATAKVKSVKHITTTTQERIIPSLHYITSILPKVAIEKPLGTV